MFYFPKNEGRLEADRKENRKDWNGKKLKEKNEKQQNKSPIITMPKIFQ